MWGIWFISETLYRDFANMPEHLLNAGLEERSSEEDERNQIYSEDNAGILKVGGSAHYVGKVPYAKSVVKS